MKDPIQTVRANELQRFSQNASHLLLKDGRLPSFLAGLNYKVHHHGPNALRGPCPVCRCSFCHIGTNGRIHAIFWKCFNGDCPSNTGKVKVHHNLLGLVRALVEGGNLGTAIKVIATFLGYEGRSFDITNGKGGRPQEAVAVQQGEDEEEEPWAYPE